MKKVKKGYIINKDVAELFTLLAKVSSGTASGIIEKMMIDYIKENKYNMIILFEDISKM